MQAHRGGRPTKAEALLIRQRRERVLQSLIEGLTEAEIGRRENVHQGQISRDLKWARQQLMDSIIGKAEEFEGIALARIAKQERRYEVAYGRSCQPREKTTKKKISGPSGDTNIVQTVTENRDGNADYLRGIDKCNDQWMEVKGVKKPVKIAPTTPDGMEPYSGTLDVGQAAACIRDIAARLGIELPGESDAPSGGAIGGPPPTP
jgi:hypothetical protein